MWFGVVWLWCDRDPSVRVSVEARECDLTMFNYLLYVPYALLMSTRPYYGIVRSLP